MQNTAQAKFEIPQNIIDDFNRIKREYTVFREIQRHLIANYLNNCGKGFRAEIKGGNGRKNYIAGGNLKKPYDLSNWKWVNVYRGASSVSVILNPLDQDPVSHNIHALYDRIGIRYHTQEENPLRLPDDTGIDLPVDGEKLAELAEILDRTMVGRKRD